MTENAIGVIRQLTGQRGMSDEAGVRFASGSSPGKLAVDVTEQPHDGDEVVDTSGARLFLDRMAARILEGKTLDASTVNGSVRFAISD
ncbi:adhesin [Phytohabitans sp. ZYX-F-186]|uniref:Adhesin n=1 Tax=Phytohabitans maris TaxID=3071409 RepID=A0ABU0ZKQ3_9ACTN|nr:adhesin [Phytohabitans sp. ZYX-F-186]